MLSIPEQRIKGTSRIVPRPAEPIEDLTNLRTVDSILAQIKEYERQTRDSSGAVGIAEVQSARGSWYYVATASEAVAGKKLGDFDTYIKFWPKDYFFSLREKLVAAQSAQQYSLLHPHPNTHNVL